MHKISCRLVSTPYSTPRLSKNPFFFLVANAILKDFSFLFGEIHRWKIPLVTSGQIDQKESE